MSALRALRLYTFFEGITLLVLVLIAMPLKYAFGLKIAVRIVGSVHGLAFLLFLLGLYRAQAELRWPLKRTLWAFASAFVPGAAFLLDRHLQKEQRGAGVRSS